MATADTPIGKPLEVSAYDLLAQQLAASPGKDLRADRPLWLFGAGNFARDVCAAMRTRHFVIQGFIETRPTRSELDGLPVFSWEQLHPSPDDQLVIAIHNRTAPLDQLAEIARTHGFADIFFPWDIHRQFSEALGWRFWLAGPDTLLSGLDRLKALHHRLADDESRHCLYRIVAFRLGLDESFGGFRHDLAQYFNPLTLPTLPKRPIHFVDGGAYDGDSLLQLAACQPIAQAYLFEPDPENYRKLTDHLRCSPFPAFCLPLGLMDTYKVLSFAGGQGEGGTVSSIGNIHIACVALDELLPNSAADFIKLDVEGAEIQALLGARNLIAKHRPTLAISLYHRPDDLWAIPAVLDDISPDYSLFIRQHYYNSFDCVLYAIPKNRFIENGA